MYNEIILILAENTARDLVKTAAKEEGFDFDIHTEYRRIRRRALFNPELRTAFATALNRELNNALDTQEKIAERERVVKEVLAINWGNLNPFKRENPDVGEGQQKIMGGGDDGKLLAQIKMLLKNEETAGPVREQLERIVGRQGQSWLGATWSGLGRAVDEVKKMPGEVSDWGHQTWDRGVAGVGNQLLRGIDYVENKMDQFANYYGIQKQALENEAARIAQEFNTSKEQAEQAIVKVLDAGVRTTGRGIEVMFSLPEALERARKEVLMTARQMQQEGISQQPSNQSIPNPQYNDYGAYEDYDRFAKNYISSMIKIADNFDKMASKSPQYYRMADVLDAALVEMA